MTVNVIKANVIQQMDYYPFGLMWQRQDITATSNLKWHQGKELQENEFAEQGKSLELEDFGARMYDPVIARWWSVDPLAYVSPGWSPYRAFYCNPKFGGSGPLTFNLDKHTVSGTVHPNDHTTSTINNANAQELLYWGVELFNNEVQRQSPGTFYGELEILQNMSRNFDPSNIGNGRGSLDFKSSLGLHEYTAIRAGSTSDGKPIITSLRAMGNMIFGNNMRNTKPYLLGTPNWYYNQVMPEVGKYNQSHNGGNGYNSGFPYYGEHTYSGSYIYYGYFGSFYK